MDDTKDENEISLLHKDEIIERIESIDKILNMQQRVYREWIHGDTLNDTSSVPQTKRKKISVTKKTEENKLSGEQVQEFYLNLINEKKVSVEQPSETKSEIVKLFDRWSSDPNSRIIHFEIDRTNKGRKLLEDKFGWTGDRGLGKDGKGRLYPIKTKFKLNRFGIGKESKEEERITHFPSKQYDEYGNEIPSKTPHPMLLNRQPKQEIQLPKKVLNKIVKKQKMKEELIKNIIFGRTLEGN